MRIDSADLSLSRSTEQKPEQNYKPSAWHSNAPRGSPHNVFKRLALVGVPFPAWCEKLCKFTSDNVL